MTAASGKGVSSTTPRGPDLQNTHRACAVLVARGAQQAPASLVAPAKCGRTLVSSACGPARAQHVRESQQEA
eukprot:2952087-Prymnesium_polylepis.1